MQILGGPSDPLERFEVVVDRDAEPADWDDALACFLLAHVKRQRSTHTGASTAGEGDQDRGG